MNNLISLKYYNQQGGSDKKIPIIEQSSNNCYFRNMMMFLLKLLDNTNTLDECKKIFDNDSSLDYFTTIDKDQTTNEENIPLKNRIVSIKLIFKILDYMSQNRGTNITNSTIIYRDKSNADIHLGAIYRFLYTGGIVGRWDTGELQYDPVSILENFQVLYEYMVNGFDLCNFNKFVPKRKVTEYYKDDGKIDEDITEFKKNFANYKTFVKIDNEKNILYKIKGQEYLLDNENDLYTILNNIYDKRDQGYHIGNDFDCELVENYVMKINNINEILSNYLSRKIQVNIRIYFKKDNRFSENILVDVINDGNNFYLTKTNDQFNYSNNDNAIVAKNWNNLDISDELEIDYVYINELDFPKKKSYTKNEIVLDQNVNSIIFQLERFYAEYYIDAADNVRTRSYKITKNHPINEFLLIDNKKFECQSIVVHEGPSAGSGHYRQFIKENGQWKYYSNSNIVDCTWDEMNDYSKYSKDISILNNAYLILYKKVSLEEIIINCNQ